jgi:enoyl-CoA hydratase/carnithine racemase
MPRFADYESKYPCVALERRDGILQMRLNTAGGPFRWNLQAQAELVGALADISADRENRVIILTGTGAEFSGPRSDPAVSVYRQSGVEPSPASLYTFSNARRFIAGWLGLEMPVIAAVNGPAMRHAEMALMCDIVLASDDATFEDTGHFHLGSHVPGDGINVVLTMLLGLNRARYMMLTGQVLSSREAKDLGLVAEVMPRASLMPRAWELAQQLARKPDPLLRHTRMVLMQPLKKLMDEGLGHFLALEALATLDSHKQG